MVSVSAASKTEVRHERAAAKGAHPLKLSA
jgi:hypothetical protein